jgi:hypothetical protein
VPAADAALRLQGASCDILFLVIPNETGPNLRGFGHETLSGMFIKQGLATG